MSGETEKQVSGWTVDTLKEHLEEKIRALNDRVTTNVEHSKDEATQLRREVDNSAEAIKLRFAGFNEFNSRMEKVTSDTMPRPEVEGRMRSLSDKNDVLVSRLEQLEKRVNTGEASASGRKEVKDDSRSWNVNVIGWIVAAAIALLAFYTKGH